MTPLGSGRRLRPEAIALAYMKPALLLNVHTVVFLSLSFKYLSILYFILMHGYCMHAWWGDAFVPDWVLACTPDGVSIAADDGIGGL